jgi:very-short-patch-repair endonuclease
VGDTELVNAAMRKGGILSSSGLAELGMSRRTIQRALRDGTLIKVRTNAYCPGRVWVNARRNPARHHMILCAAVMVSMRDEAVISHASAAVVHGLDVLGHTGEVNLWCPGRHVSRDRVRLFDGRLRPGDVTDLYGLPITTPARAAVDVARLAGFAGGLVVIDSALRSGRAGRVAMADVISACDGWPGSARAARALDLADPAAESALESLSRARFIEADFPLPETQVVLEDTVSPWRVDFLWRERRVVGEADGLTKYSDVDVIAREKRRDEQIRAAG